MTEFRVLVDRALSTLKSGLLGVVTFHLLLRALLFVPLILLTVAVLGWAGASNLWELFPLTMRADRLPPPLGLSRSFLSSFGLGAVAVTLASVPELLYRTGWRSSSRDLRWVALAATLGLAYVGNALGFSLGSVVVPFSDFLKLYEDAVVVFDQRARAFLGGSFWGYSLVLAFPFGLACFFRLWDLKLPLWSQAMNTAGGTIIFLPIAWLIGVVGDDGFLALAILTMVTGLFLPVVYAWADSIADRAGFGFAADEGQAAC